MRGESLPRICALVIGLLLVSVACGGNVANTTDFSTTTRFPDDEGVVTLVELERVQVDGVRTHSISSDVQSFNVSNGAPSELLGWKGRYVHIGLNEDGEVIWIAGIGKLIENGRPSVLYSGAVLERVDGKGRAIFADGTVLRLAQGLVPPPRGRKVRATINPETHEVIELAEERQ